MERFLILKHSIIYYKALWTLKIVKAMGLTFVRGVGLVNNQKSTGPIPPQVIWQPVDCDSLID